MDLKISGEKLEAAKRRCEAAKEEHAVEFARADATRREVAEFEEQIRNANPADAERFEGLAGRLAGVRARLAACEVRTKAAKDEIDAATVAALVAGEEHAHARKAAKDAEIEESEARCTKELRGHVSAIATLLVAHDTLLQERARIETEIARAQGRPGHFDANLGGSWWREAAGLARAAASTEDMLRSVARTLGGLADKARQVREEAARQERLEQFALRERDTAQGRSSGAVGQVVGGDRR